MSTPDPDELDRRSMQRLAAGDDAALNELMERHGPAVYRLLLGLLQNPEDALDLAQETFVRLYRARARFRRTDRLVPWLYTIATNLARNRLRWRQRHPTISWESLAGEYRADPVPATPSTPQTASSPADQLMTEERLEAVRRAVAELPASLREVVVLCEWEGLSQAEAATVLGTTVKGVESRLYRARQILRARLQPWL